MADKVESTERLSNEDKKILEREVDINVQRQVTTMSKELPEDASHREEVTPQDRTKNLIDNYNDYISQLDDILAAIAVRCKGLIYRVEATTEYDCAAAIEALFEGDKDDISYTDYVKILELEAQLSRELVAQGGQLDALGIS